MDGVAGFHVHRGCLAVGRRPGGARLPADARTVVVLEDLVDVDNLGAMVRNAAAFGADALLLSPRAADPYYRKAIRVSMGSVFTMPIVRAERWPDDLLALKQQGLSLVAAVLDEAALPLGQLHLARPGGPGAGQRGTGADGGRSGCLRSPRDHPDGPRPRRLAERGHRRRPVSVLTASRTRG